MGLCGFRAVREVWWSRRECRARAERRTDLGGWTSNQIQVSNWDLILDKPAMIVTLDCRIKRDRVEGGGGRGGRRSVMTVGASHWLTHFPWGTCSYRGALIYAVGYLSVCGSQLWHVHQAPADTDRLWVGWLSHCLDPASYMRCWRLQSISETDLVLAENCNTILNCTFYKGLLNGP